jgi:hypothetical protein
MASAAELLQRQQGMAKLQSGIYQRNMSAAQNRSNQAYRGPTVNPMGTFTSLGAYQTALDTAMKQDRAHEINMREMEWLAANQALGYGGYNMGASGAGNELADKFLNSWNQYMTDAKGIYNQALQGFNEGYDFLRDASKSVDTLNKIGVDVESDLKSFREQFGPLQSDLAAGARENLKNQQEMGAQLKGLAKADYEGVAGRAMADVSQQAEMGRQAEARRMAALGQDPTTMRSRANSANMVTGEATGKAVAANLARRGEKERVTGITGQAYQLFDPNNLASTALSIRSAGDQLQTLRGNLASQAVTAKSNLANTWGQMATAQGNIGGDIATKIGSQYGDMAGLFSGLNYANNQSFPAYPAATTPSMPTSRYMPVSSGGGNPTARVDAIDAQHSLETVNPMPGPMPAYMNYSLPQGSYFNMG